MFSTNCQSSFLYKTLNVGNFRAEKNPRRERILSVTRGTLTNQAAWIENRVRWCKFIFIDVQTPWKSNRFLLPSVRSLERERGWTDVVESLPTEERINNAVRRALNLADLLLRGDRPRSVITETTSLNPRRSHRDNACFLFSSFFFFFFFFFFLAWNARSWLRSDV